MKEKKQIKLKYKHQQSVAILKRPKQINQQTNIMKTNKKTRRLLKTRERKMWKETDTSHENKKEEYGENKEN